MMLMVEHPTPEKVAHGLNRDQNVVRFRHDVPWAVILQIVVNEK